MLDYTTVTWPFLLVLLYWAYFIKLPQMKKIISIRDGVLSSPDSIKLIGATLSEAKTNGAMITIGLLDGQKSLFKEISALFLKGEEEYKQVRKAIKREVLNLSEELFSEENHPCRIKIEKLFGQLQATLEDYKFKDSQLIYPLLLQYGELLTSFLVAQYLAIELNKPVVWIDSRELLSPELICSPEKISKNETVNKITERISKLNQESLFISQAFIFPTLTQEKNGSWNRWHFFSEAIYAQALDTKAVQVISIAEELNLVAFAKEGKMAQENISLEFNFNEALFLSAAQGIPLGKKALIAFEEIEAQFFLDTHDETQSISSLSIMPEVENKCVEIIYTKPKAQVKVFLEKENGHSIEGEEWAFFLEHLNQCGIFPTYINIAISSITFTANYTETIEADIQVIFESDFRIHLEKELYCVHCLNILEEDLPLYFQFSRIDYLHKSDNRLLVVYEN